MILSENNVSILNEYDVLVCGGGPAGISAAIQAGRLGCRTALVERYGMLGGAMTLGGVIGPMSFHAGSKQVISGIAWELMTRLASSGWAEMPDLSKQNENSVSQVRVNAVMAANMMDIMCKDAGVDLYFHQPVVDVLTHVDEGKSVMDTVLVGTKEGVKALRAKTFVDCTGDGDVAAWGGAEYELGDPKTGELQPGSLSFYLTGYQPDDVDEQQADAAYKKGKEEGRLLQGDYWGEQFWGAATILKTQGRNLNHVTVNGANSKSRSKAETEGRESVARIVNWIKKDINGGHKITPIACAPEVWVRESRRILGEGYITGADYINAKKYQDAICYSYYPVDIHQSKKKDTNEVTLKTAFLNEDNIPQIPLGALIVKGFTNLLTAGRCISGDRIAQSAYRIQATCMATGQAAGALAAMSSKFNGLVREISVHNLKNVLLENQAIVP